MADQGVSPRVAMKILGHAQISTAMNIYIYVAPELQREAAERMARAFGQRFEMGCCQICCQSAMAWVASLAGTASSPPCPCSSGG
jgi:hypothetical protein